MKPINRGPRFDAELIAPDNYDEHTSIDMPRPNIISMVEEALINHFQPRLNKQAKEAFPHTFNLDDDLEAMGVNMVMTSISGDDAGVRFSSGAVPSSFSMLGAHKKIGTRWESRIEVQDEPEAIVENGQSQVAFTRNFGFLVEGKTQAGLTDIRSISGGSFLDRVRTGFAKRSADRRVLEDEVFVRSYVRPRPYA